jgi:serine/threonine protein kinase
MRSIADFDLSRPLGPGPHGQVFLAGRPSRLPGPTLAETVAVKVLSGESTVDTFRTATRRLVAFAAVASPRLVPLYDAGQHDGVFYFSMRYVLGGSLAVPAAPVTPVAALRAVAEVALGVAALHAAGVVHGAVQPGNVLLDADGPVLADPDLSQVFLPGVMVTGSGRWGTVEFRDPRSLIGEPPGPHHDVWSLGMLLHWAVAGRAAFGPATGPDGLRALRRMAGEEPVVDPACPARLAELVVECLAAPSHRPSAAVFADRLADATAAEPAVAP